MNFRIGSSIGYSKQKIMLTKLHQREDFVCLTGLIWIAKPFPRSEKPKKG